MFLSAIFLLTQLATYLGRELSEIHEIQDSRRSQGEAPWQGEKRSRLCIAASLFGQGRWQVGLLAAFNEFPEWSGEFDEYEEVFEQPVVVVVEEEINFKLIASQEHDAALLAYVQETELAEDYEMDEETQELLAPYIKPETTVIDYGMGLAPMLTKMVGDKGSVRAFEKKPEDFRKRFWQLARKGAHNTFLYCRILEEKQRTLDAYHFEDVSVICIDANGQEDFFLKGAKNTISTQKPILLINMIGGILIEEADRYVKEELHDRLNQIEKMGYKTERIKDSIYLALPI